MQCHPMPTETIQIDAEVPEISILDAQGRFDEEMMPQLDESEIVELFRHMISARRFDERRLRLQQQGSIGTFAPVRGQEAANLGPVSAIKASDWYLPSFREPAAAVYRGIKMSQILLYDAGFNEGAWIGKDHHDFPNCVPVASQLPHAVGLAYASKYRELGEVAMVSFGDGATSEGDFHEAMNFAATWRLPVVFVCQNNQWAISVPLERQTASKTIAQKAIAYGMPGVRVDGNDLFATRYAASTAVERARKGEGPTLIECVTYRLSKHTTADDPSKYRDREDVEDWERLDPLRRMEKFVLDRELLTKSQIEEVHDRAEKAIDSAWHEARKTMEDLSGRPEVMFENLRDQRSEHLERQKLAFLRTWRAERESGSSNRSSAEKDS